ncbi:MAG: RNA-binding domain-containing protein [Nitrososphaerales archaeon]
MTKIVFMSAEVSFHLHATEDEERCLSTFAETLGIEPQQFAKSVLTGHYGNEVKRYVAHLTGQKADDWGRLLISKLDEEDRKHIAREVERHVDEHGKLYLRLDKQSLVDGSVRLGSSDVVRVKLKPRFRWNTLKMYDEFARLFLEAREG